MAECIVEEGLNAAGAKACGGSGDFWATIDGEVAKRYARITSNHGPPVVVGFDIPEEIVKDFLNQAPPWAEKYLDGRYEFHEQSFQVLNNIMTNIALTYFDEHPA